MRTTKPISTISFNTTEFLFLKLCELLKAGRISFWAYVLHEPEDDEGGKKRHHHVYVEPSRMLQTDDLKAELKEFDPSMPDKPLGCLTWNSSKFADWVMYAKHDRSYLAYKGQSRKFEYRWDDFVSSDLDDFTFKVRTIDLTHLTPIQAIREAQVAGFTFAEFFSMGHVPLPQVKFFEQAWNLLASGATYRNDKPNHSMDLEDEYHD